jgi:hypothetical protein
MQKYHEIVFLQKHWQKLQKILIITSTPRFLAFRREQQQRAQRALPRTLEAEAEAQLEEGLLGASETGTDVIIFKIFSPRKWLKWRFLFKILPTSCSKKGIMALFLRKTQIVSPKMCKNCRRLTPGRKT